jgi:hypothetical protein
MAEAAANRPPHDPTTVRSPSWLLPFLATAATRPSPPMRERPSQWLLPAYRSRCHRSPHDDVVATTVCSGWRAPLPCTAEARRAREGPTSTDGTLVRRIHACESEDGELYDSLANTECHVWGIFSMLRTMLRFAICMHHFYCLSVYKMLQSML